MTQQRYMEPCSVCGGIGGDHDPAKHEAFVAEVAKPSAEDGLDGRPLQEPDPSSSDIFAHTTPHEMVASMTRARLEGIPPAAAEAAASMALDVSARITKLVEMTTMREHMRQQLGPTEEHRAKAPQPLRDAFAQCEAMVLAAQTDLALILAPILAVLTGEVE